MNGPRYLVFAETSHILVNFSCVREHMVVLEIEKAGRERPCLLVFCDFYYSANEGILSFQGLAFSNCPASR